jgi:hypothetical protein
VSATQLDGVLHAERLDGIAQKRYAAQLADLPAGAMVMLDTNEHAYLVQPQGLLRWQPSGYDEVIAPPQDTWATVLTPRSIVNTLRAGFPIGIHSALLQK